VTRFATPLELELLSLHNTSTPARFKISRDLCILLKKNQTHQSAVLYMSDHGESLGEKGLYLHGMPYFIAPKEQTHVPSIAWFDKQFSK
jgi:lipid A ethanolaminephosphotransferase